MLFLSVLVILFCKVFRSPEKKTTPLQLVLFTVRQFADVHIAYKRLSCQLSNGEARQAFGIRPILRLPTVTPDVSSIVSKSTVTGWEAHVMAVFNRLEINVTKSLRFLMWSKMSLEDIQSTASLLIVLLGLPAVNAIGETGGRGGGERGEAP